MADVQNGATSVLRLSAIRLGEAADEKLFSSSPIQKRRAKQ